jgi:6-pyruvoyltetrahydropterin/6-carboxytetrahydropterin synthase
MSELYKVRVAKDHLIFCCGHFITYEGDQCERLHGHNYRAAVEIEGPLDENHYVFDFIALKKFTKAITDELDHHVLLPTKNAFIIVIESPQQVRVRYHEREWLFPREDCILLPLENTTAELLAQYTALRLLAELKSERGFTPEVLRLEVEENTGQSATYEWRKA